MSEKGISTDFRRAADAERERLLERRHELVANLDALRTRKQALDAELSGVDHRLSLVEAAASDPAAPRPLRPAGNAVPLQGSKIRNVAVEVLAQAPEGAGPVHYRRWLELVEEGGYQVAGKRPDAVFLSQVARSPVIRGATRAGYYYIDWNAPEALERQVERLQAELADELGASSGDAEKRRRLLVSLERNQRALEEARRTLQGSGAKPREAA